MSKQRKPVVFFDLETTSADASTARIVQLAYRVYSSTGDACGECLMLNPLEHITEGASKVHGYTDEMVKNYPTFATVANKLLPLFDGSIWGGYNNANFDNEILKNEFLRIGIEPPKMAGYIDCFKVFCHYEGRSYRKGARTLTAAHKFYCLYGFDDAHSAMADVDATINVFKHQLKCYNTDMDAIIKLSSRIEKNIDRYGIFKFIGSEHIPTICIGMHNGKPLREVPRGYLVWMLNSGNFKEDVVEIVRYALEGIYPQYGKNFAPLIAK